MKVSYALSILLTAVIQPLLSMGQPTFTKNGSHPYPVDSAVKSKISQWMKGNGGISFLENKGQMADMDGNPISGLLFKASGSGVDMYVTTGGLSYVFTQKEILKTKKLNSLGQAQDSLTGQYCRADMELVGADIRKENIVKEDESKDYSNYYLGKICPNGVLNVHSYQRITIKNIYPGIDWVLYTDAGRKSANVTPSPIGEGRDRVVMPSPIGEGREGVEYDFVVHPGADPSLIKLRYKYTDMPEVQNNGSMKISLPLGYIMQGTPVTYQPRPNGSSGRASVRHGGLLANIHTTYTLQKGEVSFALANYDKSKVLVIDPTVSWGLHWSTYYGGIGTDAANSIWSDGTDVYVTGSTASTNFPTTTLAGAYNQGTLTGATQNIFILCFNAATGATIWATYYGGTSNGESDAGKGISGDANNIWVVGQSNASGSSFPTYCNPVPTAVTTTSYNWYQQWTSYTNYTGLTPATTPPNTTIGNNSPGLVLEFKKSTGARLYATFLSGTSGAFNDNLYSVWDDGTDVWVAGAETSIEFPVLYTGTYYYSTGSDNGNPTLAEFSASNGALLWSTCIGSGSAGSGNALSVCSDGTNVWMTGCQYGGDVPVTPPPVGGFYQNTSPSNSCTWIGKIAIATHTIAWATYYGGNANTSQSYAGSWVRTGYGNAIYSNGTDVWLTGTTGSSDFSTRGMLLQPAGAYYQTTNAISGTTTGFHAFIAEFNTSTCALLWGTYYGGSNTSSGNGTEAERGNGLYTDNQGNLWVTGETQSTNFPLLPLACSFNQSTLQGAQNGFLLEFNTSGVRNWATFFGGNGTDEGNSIWSTGTNVWMTGGTTSSTLFPLQNLPGAYNQPTNGGGAGIEDAFISEFAPVTPLAATMGPSTNAVCGLSNGSVTVTVTGGTTPYTYSWSPTGGTSATGTGLSAGSYTVYITFLNGCTDSSTVTVSQTPAMVLTMSAPTNTSCYSGSNGSATVSVTGGASPYTYSWSPIGGTNATGTGLSVGNFTVTVHDNNGCSQIDSVSISQPPPVTGSISSTGELCYGYSTASATVTPTGGFAPYNYVWNPGGQNGSTAVGLAAGVYTVTIIDAHGCSGSATIDITQPTQTDVAFSSNVVQGCAPLCIQFYNETPVSTSATQSYVWFFGDGDTSYAQNPAYCYSTGGVYSVELTVTIAAGGCSATLNKINLITVFSEPNAAFSYSPNPATIISPTIQFTNQSADPNQIIQWWWTFGDQTDSVSAQQNPAHTYQDTGTYCTTLVVTDINGCTDTATNCLLIEPLFTLYIPDAFSPNGDGINDVFMAKGEYVKSFEMYIFDRWGQELFHSNNINDGWNGTVKGSSSICQEDIYVYKILATDYANKQHSYIGNITLLK